MPCVYTQNALRLYAKYLAPIRKILYVYTQNRSYSFIVTFGGGHTGGTVGARFLASQAPFNDLLISWLMKKGHGGVLFLNVIDKILLGVSGSYQELTGL